MPAKKTTKKVAKKKVATKKAATKKVAAKKASAAKPVAPKKKALTKVAKKSTTKKQAGKAGEQSKEAAKKPSITSGVPRPSLGKKASPISFSLEDAVGVVASRQEAEAVDKKSPAAKAAKPVSPSPKKVAKPAAEAPTQTRKHGAASLADILGFNPAQKKSETELEENQIPKKWIKYYRLLIDLRKHVKDELSLHTADTLKRSNRDDSGDLSGYGQHQADAATDNFDRDFALSLLSAEQDALYEIEQAIKRIKSDNYGRCEVTGEPINKARLAAVPFTRFSVEGQKEFEKNRRRKVDRGGAFADNSEGVSLASDDDSDE